MHHDAVDHGSHRVRCRSPGQALTASFAGVAWTCLAWFAIPPSTASTIGEEPRDCRSGDFTWSSGDPKVNQRHIFCGEIEHDRAKGFHSTQLQATAPLIAAVQRQRAEGGGIYTAIVTFRNSQRKLSTFFPNWCTVDQIVLSVQYAANHVHGASRVWGLLGMSAPSAGASGYCLDDHGEPFEIRLGMLADGRVNTAFPN